MGEVAEMMLDGTMCAGCGEWLHGGEDGDGFPGYCASCAPDFDAEPTEDRHVLGGSPSPRRTNCPECGKRVKKVGLADHQRDKHGKQPEAEASS